MTPTSHLLNYSFYPGCSLHASAKEYEVSTKSLFRALRIGLREVPNWFCCGATPAHNVDELLSLSLCAKNLELSNAVEGDLAVACAACFSRLKTAQHKLEVFPEKARQVEEALDAPLAVNKPVKHLLDILARDFGLDRLEAAVQKPLAGLKVACYYGCLLTRPPEVPDLDDCEDPTIMEDLLRAVGAEPVEWSHRMECCGANFTLSRPEVVRKLSGEILGAAQAAGADCLMVACPLCHGNLDIRQDEIAEYAGIHSGTPIFYITQLVGLAVGVSSQRLGLNNMIVDPKPLLKLKNLI